MSNALEKRVSVMSWVTRSFPKAAGTSKSVGFLDARNSQTIVDITIREKVHPTDIEN